MISEVLDFITTQLDNFLLRKSPDNKSLVKLSGIVKPSQNVSEAKENKLLVSVVNIAEEVNIAHQSNFNSQTNYTNKQNNPLYLNVYILISADFTDHQYKEGLHYLSSAISFFNQHTTFSSSQVNMPKGIDKVSLELVSLDINSMGRFWSGLGVSYQPSVIYKIRMLKMTTDLLDARIPEIKNPNTNIT